MNVSIKELVTMIENKKIIKDISLEIKKGQFVGIIGPNGSGKSTLLKTIYRLYQPANGTITFDNKDTRKLSNREFARKVAVVGQENSVPFDFSVEEIVLMGRNPHKRVFEGINDEDRKKTRQALDKVGLVLYKNRSFASLSGGEKQRVYIARSLVQEPRLFILDEPTNHLDIHHQLQLLDIVKEMKVSTIAALHDLNLAAAYCDKMVVLKEGRVVTVGPPEEILTETLLKNVFHVNSRTITHPLTGKRQVLYSSDSPYQKQRLVQKQYII